MFLLEEEMKTMKANGLRLPKAVSINEEILGDGFQGEERTISTDTKVFLLEHLVDAGFKRITVGNFGNPAQIPFFRNTDELYRHVPPRPGVMYNAMAANMRAVQRAVELKKEGVRPRFCDSSSVHGRSFLQVDVQQDLRGTVAIH